MTVGLGQEARPSHTTADLEATQLRLRLIQKDSEVGLRAWPAKALARNHTSHCARKLPVAALLRLLGMPKIQARLTGRRTGGEG